MKKVLSLILILVLLTGCDSITGHMVKEEANSFVNETLPLQVARLEPLNLQTVDSFDKYRSFADNMNDLIAILNEKGNFDIEPYLPTIEGWQKASKTITEWTPLINNYNEVVNTAKTFERDPTNETRKNFYFASGKFSFETAIIVGAVFYSASYQIVGIGYRGLGLNTMAFKCGSCVSIILSQAHWFVRTVLVESASQVATDAITKVEKMYHDGTLERGYNSTSYYLDDGVKRVSRGFNNLSSKFI